MGANFKTDIMHDSTTKFSGVRGGDSNYNILLPSWGSITLPNNSSYYINFYIGLDFVDDQGTCRQEAGVSIKGDEFNDVNNRGWRYFWNSSEGQIYNSRNHGDLKITNSYVILTLKAEEGPETRDRDSAYWDGPLGTSWGNRARSRVKFYVNGNFIASAWVPSASDTKNCYFPKYNAGCEFFATSSSVKHTDAVNFQKVYGIRWEWQGGTATEVYNLLSTTNYTINGTKCWNVDGVDSA